MGITSDSFSKSKTQENLQISERLVLLGTYRHHGSRRYHGIRLVHVSWQQRIFHSRLSRLVIDSFILGRRQSHHTVGGFFQGLLLPPVVNCHVADILWCDLFKVRHDEGVLSRIVPMTATGEDWKEVSAADSFATKRPNTLLGKERSLKPPSESPQVNIKMKMVS